jgi:hypothetical protein
VETPDARVMVHGTRFSVVVEPTADGPRTRVHVTHGIVSVHEGGREVFLRAGQSFATAVAKSEPSATAASSASDAVAEPATDVDAGLDDDEVDDGLSSHAADKPVRAVARLEFDSRELADQNERFARAMAHKKNGEPRAALRELAGILRRYPGSPLTQELRVERLRLLRGLGASRSAQREAKRYLREFPDGYAVKEAEALLTGAH